jgi:hypothetical protein
MLRLPLGIPVACCNVISVLLPLGPFPPTPCNFDTIKDLKLDIHPGPVNQGFVAHTAVKQQIHSVSSPGPESAILNAACIPLPLIHIRLCLTVFILFFFMYSKSDQSSGSQVSCTSGHLDRALSHF